MCHTLFFLLDIPRAGLQIGGTSIRIPVKAK